MTTRRSAFYFSVQTGQIIPVVSTAFARRDPDFLIREIEVTSKESFASAAQSFFGSMNFRAAAASRADKLFALQTQAGSRAIATLFFHLPG
jgi:hypothetical protein